MTEPQLPPPSPYGSVPPAPPAPSSQPSPAQTNGHAPQYASPPGAYAAPLGGYAAPMGSYQAPEPSVPRSAALGTISFVLSIVAAVIAPIIVGFAGYQIGFRLPTVMEYVDSTTADLSFLSPVRDQVLMGEIGFWAGTLTGIAAIVLGIIAIAKRQGRVWGVVALILAVLGPVIFFVVLGITLGFGTGTGAVSYYGA